MSNTDIKIIPVIFLSLYSMIGNGHDGCLSIEDIDMNTLLQSDILIFYINMDFCDLSGFA